VVCCRGARFLILVQDEHEAKVRTERAKLEEDILKIQAELETQRWRERDRILLKKSIQHIFKINLP
jgi:hypothetical protein